MLQTVDATQLVANEVSGLKGCNWHYPGVQALQGRVWGGHIKQELFGPDMWQEAASGTGGTGGSRTFLADLNNDLSTT